MFTIHKKNIVLNDNRIIELETGRLARQADGAVLLKMGKTMLLATAVSAEEANLDLDYLPLSVDYRENFASVGRIPGGFFKREGKPSDHEILISRLVDRAMRPLFPNNYHAETFINIFLISAEKDVMPDALAGLAASAAVAVSNIPFNGPISEVRVARINNELKINPTYPECQLADIDIIVGATADSIVMVEGEMNEVSEADMIEALKFAHEEIKKHCAVQLELVALVNKTKRTYEHENNDEAFKCKVHENTYKKVYDVAKSQIKDKHQRKQAFKVILDELLESIPEELKETHEPLAKRYFHEVEREALRNLLLNERVRIDGRKPDEIRPIHIEIDFLPSAHGSALFTRGETQSLTTVTLGTKLDEKIIDEALVQGSEKFVLHYNFPPFSTNDARPIRATSRREVGHGNLAHRALNRMVPTNPEENPYAIRVVSDILESNGSSSMATVCAGTLALMDAGVKIKKPVSGIAMGLVTDEKGKYVILSDILGDEDHLGDMDFKVTGTADGITACQMDIKVKGLSYEILKEALEQAHRGRLHILDKITSVIDKPRSDYKPHAPRVVKLTIDKEFIGAVIGTGGKVIQEIQSLTNTTIVIEEVDKMGIVDIFATNKEDLERAVAIIKGIVAVPEIGTVYKGKVVSIVAFGAFVEFLPKKEGLLHISEIEWRRLKTVDEVLKVGDIVEVKLIEIEREGKYRLSRKALLPKPNNENKQ